MSQQLSVLPRPRSVAGSAVGSGCSGWWVRASQRSQSGVVVVACFPVHRSAASFARVWSQRLGLPVFVRRSRSVWLVSVPVSAAVPGPAIVAAPVVIPPQGVQHVVA